MTKKIIKATIDRQIADDIVKIADEILNEGYLKSNNLDEVSHLILLSLFFKGYLTFRAILLLVDSKMGCDAGILARTLFDVCYLSNFITHKDTNERAKRYFDYIFCAKPMQKENSRKLNLPDSMESFGIREDLAKKFEKLKNQYSKKDIENMKQGRWSGMTLQKMLEEIGLWKDYIRVSMVHSGSVHANDLAYYFELPQNNDKKNIILSDKKYSDISQSVLIGSITSFLRMLGCINKIFAIGLDSKIEKQIMSFESNRELENGK